MNDNFVFLDVLEEGDAPVRLQKKSNYERLERKKCASEMLDLPNPSQRVRHLHG